MRTLGPGKGKILLNSSNISRYLHSICFRTVHEAYGFPQRNSNGFNPLAQDYYGIKGLRRVSNFWIVVFCVVFTAFGIGVQALAIRYIEMFVLLAGS